MHHILNGQKYWFDQHYIAMVIYRDLKFINFYSTWLLKYVPTKFIVTGRW